MTRITSRGIDFDAGIADDIAATELVVALLIHSPTAVGDAGILVALAGEPLETAVVATEEDRQFPILLSIDRTESIL